MRTHLSIAVTIGISLALTFALTSAHGQTGVTTLDDASRRAVIEAAAKALRDRYVYPDVGEQAAAAIEAESAAGSFDTIADPETFARRLTTDLERVGHDKHLYVTPPVRQAPAESANSVRPLQPLSEGGVTRADRLAGNIGYIEVFAFSPLDIFKPPADQVMATLKGVRALIIDVRRNIGGDPASVNHLLSYFVGKAPVQIGSSVSRTPGTKTFTTQEYWINTKPAVSFAGMPIFVLTSAATFSGGEAFAYNMQNLKLGTLVGETTGGAANLTNSVPLVLGFQISVPYARSSESTWEGVGVKPDIAVPSAEALTIALQRLGQEPSSGEIEALSQARLFTPRATPAPGGEAAVRRMIQELQSDAPKYELLNEAMAKALRERFTSLHEMLMKLGAVESVRFVEINWIYGDIYDVKFANGSVYWAIALDSQGRIVMWEVKAV